MRTIIRAGELTDKLTIKSKTVEYPEGFPVETITDAYELYCKPKTVSTKEYIAAGRENIMLTHKFIVPKSEIDSDMFIEYHGNRWEINHVHAIDDFYYELTATIFAK